LLLDVTGLEHIFGSAESLARQVQQDLEGQGYEVRLAVADTVGLAWAWAHHMHPQNATDTLPVAALRLSDPVLDLLGQLGIATVGQLKQIARGSLAARLGNEPLRRLDQLTGAVTEPIVPHQPLTELTVSWSLEFPTSRREAIAQVLLRLVERLVQQVIPTDQGMVELSCRLQCEGEGGRALDLPVGLFRPSIDAKYLVELLLLRLDQTALPGPIANLCVSVPATAPLVWRQQELFGASSLAAERQLSLLVNRLSGRLGAGRVVRAVPHAGHQPERSFRYVPLTGGPDKPKRPAAKRPPPTAVQPGQWPLALYAAPRPIEVMSVVPDGPLVWFRDAARRQRVARQWGPQRIATGWWRGRSVERDYYRIETESGTRFWIFRRLPDGNWFLHGEFV
jgi:protein ImuB